MKLTGHVDPHLNTIVKLICRRHPWPKKRTVHFLSHTGEIFTFGSHFLFVRYG
jgi:hypothetical protein